MNIIALGDLHGRTKWINIVAKHSADKVVFMGDYFDAKGEIPSEYQQMNFRDLIAYKRTHKDRVVLLIGNHDYHYRRGAEETYSGFQEWQKAAIQTLLHDAFDEGLLQVCFSVEHMLFSHAGITNTWLRSTGYNAQSSIEQFVNNLFRSKPDLFGFYITKNYTSSNNGCQSPIWVRPEGLLPDMPAGYLQVAGHTPQDYITVYDQQLALIDTLGTSGEYLFIENGHWSARSL